ncbi:MAG: hypothetical protein WB627_06435 [Candidatus Acidiferrum sp.]
MRRFSKERRLRRRDGYDTLNRSQTLTPPAAFRGSGSFGLSYDALSRRT